MARLEKNTVIADDDGNNVASITGGVLSVGGLSFRSGGTAPVYSEITFTETAAAGTYTGTVAIPAGACITFVSWQTTAAWAADTTALDAGYTAALTAFANAADVDAAAGATLVPAAALAPTVHAAAVDFVAKIVTTGTGGTTGRTRVFVAYTVSPPITVATKVAA